MDSKFVKSYYNISTKLLEYNIKQSINENFVLSPHSYIELMNILFEGSDNDTKTQIVKAFGYDKKNILKLKNSVKEMCDILKSTKELKSTNALFTKMFKKSDFKKDFLSILKKCNGELFISKNLSDDITKWVKKQTKGLIQALSIPICDDTIVGILNAVAFDAKWEEDYRKSDILEDLEFKNVDKTKSKVDFLKSEEDIYLENEYITGFIKPYKNYSYSFVGLLPKKEGKKELKRVVESFDLYKTINQNENCDIDVFIPKFENKYVANLNGFCKSLGIKEMFTENADFGNMTSAPVHVSSIDQQAYIKVDEKGTKTASVTMSQFLFTGASGFIKRKKVHLDRPFVYAIIHNRTKLPIFVGIVNKM